MRQVKRLIYIILLNIIVSAVTLLVILNLWERNHPLMPGVSTPVVIYITSTPPVQQTVISDQDGSNSVLPTDTGVIIASTPAATPAIKTIVYQVKQGDTLGALANEFNVSVADIMTVNNLSDPDSLFVGQILHIPTEPLPTITPTSAPTITPTITPRPSMTPTQGPLATATNTQPSQEAQLIIETVIGAGVLSNEHVVLQRTGDGELSLAGWRLSDDAGYAYTFPQLTLYKGLTINLNTRQGENTVQDLYWGLTSSIWKTGKTAYLYDAQNKLRASYTVP
jgi:LysM repeat protein